MKRPNVIMSVLWGTGAAASLLLLFVFVVRILSGNWAQVTLQFREIGVFLVILAVGFGIQVAMLLYLRASHKHAMNATGATAVSGSSSTVGMLACCTHYLANIMPFFGLAGVASVLSEYQVPILVASIGINILGIAYLVHLLQKHSNAVKKEAHC